MSKKTYKILIIACAAVFIIGLVLTAQNNSTYHYCIMEMAKPYSASSYAYAVSHITQFAVMYYGGMVIMAVSAITAGVLTVGRYLKKNEKPVFRQMSGQHYSRI